MRRFGALPSHVHFVPIDFNAERLDTALTREGLDLEHPALFLWEGVTQYLQPEAVDAVIRSVAARPAGSELVFTYVIERAISGRNHAGRPDPGLMGVEPWIFGIEPSRLATFLSERGLTLREDVGAEEHLARYVHPAGRDLVVSNVERVARASV